MCFAEAFLIALLFCASDMLRRGAPMHCCMALPSIYAGIVFEKCILHLFYCGFRDIMNANAGE